MYMQLRWSVCVIVKVLPVMFRGQQMWKQLKSVDAHVTPKYIKGQCWQETICSRRCVERISVAGLVLSCCVMFCEMWCCTVTDLNDIERCYRSYDVVDRLISSLGKMIFEDLRNLLRKCPIFAFNNGQWFVKPVVWLVRMSRFRPTVKLEAQESRLWQRFLMRYLHPSPILLHLL